MRDVVGIDAPRNSATSSSFAAGSARRYAIARNCGTDSPCGAVTSHVLSHHAHHRRERIEQLRGTLPLVSILN